MPINACNKGKVGEREWRDVVQSHGYDCRRGRQFSGSPESPDVVSADLDFVHFEVKRVEHLSIYTAVGQAKKDCGGKLPVVAYRQNNKEWLCVMPAEVFFNLIRHRMFLKGAE